MMEMMSMTIMRKKRERDSFLVLQRNHFVLHRVTSGLTEYPVCTDPPPPDVEESRGRDLSTTVMLFFTRPPLHMRQFTPSNL